VENLPTIVASILGRLGSVSPWPPADQEPQQNALDYYGEPPIQPGWPARPRLICTARSGAAAGYRRSLPHWLASGPARFLWQAA